MHDDSAGPVGTDNAGDAGELRVLLAGDHFVRNDLLEDRLRQALPADAAARLDVRSMTLPWPMVPYGRVQEVDEASDVEDELLAQVGDVEVAVTQMAPFTRRVLEAAPSLGLIVCTRGGPVNVNVQAATERGIAVCNTPGRNAVAAAEHAVTLILAALRSIPRVHASVAAGEWRSDLYAYDECGLELGGSTVGLVGYGAIGRRVARILRAFDAEVLVSDPFVAADDLGPGVRLVDLDTLLAASDVVSLHARLTPETENLINSTTLAAMRPGSYLINTARGGLVDDQALAAALHSGHLAGAGLDVYPREPIPAGWPLLSSDRVVMTPHLAGATRQTAHRAAELAAASVAAFLAGERPPGMVNPEIAVAG
ncbi:2-hydroxyacid dehydrogenase [Phytoactinopolyspora halotolerans]|uniref:2-hydroxyacid dehydrogenase n=1 Tax=Phytoactinopolyspora halotolerans TaxID=1981512 RepID=A0A6L9S6Q4_9ACTN|nr:2-hydroxyacid dehydrogenase [Phytoactinopolyspora halotolerans]NEE00749.1 2-hydroxyacid dehydrogenase [Phytoactinopolyspora halotolerans]